MRDAFTLVQNQINFKMFVYSSNDAYISLEQLTPFP